MIKKGLKLILVLLFFSCGKSEATLSTLNFSIEDRILENAKWVRGMEAMIRDRGDREDDVKILLSARNIIALKSRMGLPSDSDEIDSLLTISKLQNYHDSLIQLSRKSKHEIDDEIEKRIELFTQETANETTVRSFYLSLLQLESKLVFHHLRRIGVFCGWTECLEFTFHRKNKVVNVGDRFESILSISIQEFGEQQVSYQFDSVRVYFEGESVQFETNELAGSQYLVFEAESAGTYEYKGILHLEEKRFGNSVSCPFSYIITVQ